MGVHLGGRITLGQILLFAGSGRDGSDQPLCGSGPRNMNCGPWTIRSGKHIHREQEGQSGRTYAYGRKDEQNRVAETATH